MRKDLKKTGIFALIVFAFLAFVIFEINKFQKEEEVKETKDRVVKIASSKINKVEIGNFVFEKIGFNWKALEGDFSDYISKDSFENWLSEAVGTDGRVLSEPDEEVSWVKFGFGEDSKTLVLSSEKKKVKITLSNRTAFDGGAYLKVQEDKKNPILYASDETWLKFFDNDFDKLRVQEAFNWTVQDVNSSAVSFESKKESQSKTLKLSFKDTKWTSGNSDHKKWSFDTAKVASLLEDIRKFRVKEFLKEKVSGFVKYGEFSVKTDKNNKYTLKIIKKKDVFFGESSFRPGVYFSLGKNNINTFFPDAYDLRSFDDALSFNQDEVQSISYKKSSKTLNFSKKDDGEWRFVGKLEEGKVFNSASVIKLFSLMKNIKIERYFVRKPYLSEQPSLSLIRKNKEGEYVGFRLYKKEYSCVEGEEKKDCYVLVSNGKTLAFKKEESKAFFEIDFFNKALAEEEKNEAGPLKNEKVNQETKKEDVNENN